jgi:hypothetical protein
VALSLVLAGLNEALQLVGVLGELGLDRLVGLVLVDELAHRLTDLSREVGHLVGGHLGMGAVTT